MQGIIDKWKEFVGGGVSEITKLRIFDFDETIAHTEAHVGVIEPDGTTFKLNDQADFDNYIKKEAAKFSDIDVEAPENFDLTVALSDKDYQFDFSDFSKVINPEENERIVKIIRDLMAANEEDKHREIYVMTARRDDAIKAIQKYLKELGFSRGDFAGVIALGGESKKEAIERLIAKHINEEGVTTIESIHFFDDSKKNLEDVKQLIGEYPNIEDIRIKQVLPDGIITLE